MFSEYGTFEYKRHQSLLSNLFWFFFLLPQRDLIAFVPRFCSIYPAFEINLRLNPMESLARGKANDTCAIMSQILEFSVVLRMICSTNLQHVKEIYLLDVSRMIYSNLWFHSSEISHRINCSLVVVIVASGAVVVVEATTNSGLIVALFSWGRWSVGRVGEGGEQLCPFYLFIHF